MTDVSSDIDCLIVGGGPAGLTAAIYASRFHLRTVVVDEGASRAGLIPKTRNHAGFPGGIAGAELLSRMREQAQEFGVTLRSARVETLSGKRGRFQATLRDGEPIEAKAVILATGVSNRRPDMPTPLHDEALRRGLLRYCPVCDGFEVTDQAVCVVGDGDRAIRETRFLRSFTSRLTVVWQNEPFTPAQRADLSAMSVTVLEGPPREFAADEAHLSLIAGQTRHSFDALYPALGSDIHSQLAAMLGADLTDDGCVRVDAHQRTSVKGLYAAGDVVIGLDQISHAMGEAGVAATTLRNDLAEHAPLLRNRPQ